jgi:D-alanyl-D-alanine carboxypeptidase
MYRWLNSALDYIPQWIEFQMRQSEQPGCVIAIAYKGQIVLEQAFGHADLSSGEPLTPRHRFRVASHSKSFTAAGIMKLREQGKLRLDDAVGRHVDGLHPALAKATIAQLLSHSAGVVRDGADSGQWQDRRPFLDVAELRTALAEPPVIGGNTLQISSPCSAPPSPPL